MDDNCGEWVESTAVASGCGCKEVYIYTHNYVEFLILLILTPLVSALIGSIIAASSLLFVHFVRCFSFFLQ